MAIKLTQEQIERLKLCALANIDVVRPSGCKVVHIRHSWNSGTGFCPPTFCGRKLSGCPSWPPKLWTDNFCAKCVERALRMLETGAGGIAPKHVKARKY